MSNNNHQMTINKLFKLCKEQIAKGNGNKFIVISDDNEGNGFHGLFYGFGDASEWNEYIYDSAETDTKNLVILG